MIHTRDAWDDTFDVLDAEGVPERTVFHCFTGGPDEARALPRPGRVPVSFSGIVTFKTATDLQAAAALCPARPAARRDRQPLPGAGAAPRPHQPAGLRHPRRGVRRRPPRHAVGRVRRRHGRATRTAFPALACPPLTPAHPVGRVRPCTRSARSTTDGATLRAVPMGDALPFTDEVRSLFVMDVHERRRVVLATAFTLVALPAIWLFDRDDPRLPSSSVAAAGVPDAEVGRGAGRDRPYEPRSRCSSTTPSSSPPPPSSTSPSPDAPGANEITGTASFQRFDPTLDRRAPPRWRPTVLLLTVANLDNGLSITCRNTLGVSIPYGVTSARHRSVHRDRRSRRLARPDPAVLVAGPPSPASVLSRADVTRLLADHGLAPRRDLGQNFVGDPNTVRRIARLADVGPGDRVVEIGAGLGSLTLALAETGAAVRAVEVDRGVVPVLREVVARLPERHRGRGRRDGSSTGPSCWPVTTDWVLVANLPYNVATPLRARPARRRAGHRPHAGDGAAGGGRAVLAAPRTPAYGAVTVKVALLGHGPHRRRSCRRACSCPDPTSSRRSPRSPAAPAPAIDADPTSCSTSCARRSASAARCCAARSPAWWPRGVRGRRHRRQRRPEELDVDRVGSAHRRVGRARPCSSSNVTDPADRSPHVVTVEAPAKLTLSLRITGVRDDGYHLIDAEMVTLDLADLLTIDPDRRRARRPTAPSPPACPLDDDNLVRRALRLAGRQRPRAPPQAHPARWRPGRRLGRRRRGAALGRRTTTSSACSRLGADVPFCLVRRSGPGDGHRRGRRTPAPLGARRHPGGAAARGEHPGRVPGLGRARRPHGRRPERPRAGGDRRGARAGRVARPHRRRCAGVAPVLAGSGATWFVEGHHPALRSLAPEATVVLTRTRV